MKLPNPRIVTDPSELSPPWMTDVLRTSGLDVTVRALRHEPVGTGQMAHNERIYLEYDPGQSSGPTTIHTP